MINISYQYCGGDWRIDKNEFSFIYISPHSCSQISFLHQCCSRFSILNRVSMTPRPRFSFFIGAQTMASSTLNRPHISLFSFFLQISSSHNYTNTSITLLPFLHQVFWKTFQPSIRASSSISKPPLWFFKNLFRYFCLRHLLWRLFTHSHFFSSCSLLYSGNGKKWKNAP